MTGDEILERNLTRRRRLDFVSHSSRDTWVARQIAKEIEQVGAQAFLDATSIEAGDDFIEQIRDYLRRADELVILRRRVRADE